MDISNPILTVLKETFQRWQEDNVSRLSAALAYHTVFALAPLLIIAIAIAGLAFGQQDVQSYVLGQLARLLDERSLDLLRSMIMSMRDTGSNIVATVIGVGTLIFGSSRVFNELQQSLNTIWGVEPEPEAGIQFVLRKRLISFAMIMGIGFLLLLAFLFITFLTALKNILALPYLSYLIPVINFLFITLLAFLLFGLIYKVLPDVQIAWRDVAVGAGITAALFSLGQLLIGLYLVNSSFSSTYGAAGSFLVILIWIFYSAQILYFGAEFTEVYAYMYGSRVRPAEDAVFISDRQNERRQVESRPQASLDRQLLNEQRPRRTPSGDGFQNPLLPVLGILAGVLVGFILSLPWKKAEN
jgi:membrane protein